MSKKYTGAITGIIIFSVVVLFLYFNQFRHVEEEITEEQVIKNVSTFTKLFGYIRYFHPSDESEKLNWNHFAIYGVDLVKDSRNDKELKDNLTKLFTPIAPTLQLYEKHKKPLDPFKTIDVTDSSIQSIAWQHLGLGTDFSRQNSTYDSKRVIYNRDSRKTEKELFENVPNPGEVIHVEISEQLSATIPLSLFIKEQVTLGSTDITMANYEKLTEELKHFDINSYSSEHVRMAAVSVLWNTIQHFYPYHEEVNLVWNKKLSHYLKDARNAKGASDFTNILKRMLVELKDGHASINIENREHNILAKLPYSLEFIDEKFVISETFNKELFKLGDEVLSINNEEIETIFNEERSHVSGSEQYRDYLTLASLRMLDSQEPIKVSVLRNGQEVTHTLYDHDLNGLLSPTEVFREIEDGIFYIDMTKASGGLVEENIQELASAKGIIFDFRGYVAEYDLDTTLFPHLTNKKITGPILKVPQIIYPDQQKWSYFEMGMDVLPQEPYLEAKKVFLIDESAFSATETFLAFVETHQLGELVGSPTAGANGDINIIDLPGGASFQFTGLKVVKGNGSQHHLVGIIPTVPVERTIDGIKNGEDECLNRAIELIRGRGSE
ncbi:S41 family peptidase [Cytobacillus sp. FJAT-54145]|uniref:S41 family peptidase n=1 Tax=Cytobacillus spartinae TaxID=3299023 RepID=A0ABW6KAW8_9BACI